MCMLFSACTSSIIQIIDAQHSRCAPSCSCTYVKSVVDGFMVGGR
jgi:hypothetical protein